MKIILDFFNSNDWVNNVLVVVGVQQARLGDYKNVGSPF